MASAGIKRKVTDSRPSGHMMQFGTVLIAVSLIAQSSAIRLQPKESSSRLATIDTLLALKELALNDTVPSLNDTVLALDDNLLAANDTLPTENVSSNESTPTLGNESAEQEDSAPMRNREHRLLAAVLPDSLSNWNAPADDISDLDEAGSRDPFGSLTEKLESWLGVVGLSGAVPLALLLVSLLLVFLHRSRRTNNRHQFKHRGRVIYEWHQCDTKMFMYIQLPQNIDNEGELDIRISPRHVRIARLGKPPFIKDQLYLAVDDEESSWKISNGRELEICFVKSEPGEWPCVLLPHPPEK
jgi:hypothetical protein